MGITNHHHIIIHNNNNNNNSKNKATMAEPNHGISTVDKTVKGQLSLDMRQFFESRLSLHWAAAVARSGSSPKRDLAANSLVDHPITKALTPEQMAVLCDGVETILYQSALKFAQKTLAITAEMMGGEDSTDPTTIDKQADRNPPMRPLKFTPRNSDAKWVESYTQSASTTTTTTTAQHAVHAEAKQVNKTSPIIMNTHKNHQKKLRRKMVREKKRMHAAMEQRHRLVAQNMPPFPHAHAPFPMYDYYGHSASVTLMDDRPPQATSRYGPPSAVFHRDDSHEHGPYHRGAYSMEPEDMIQRTRSHSLTRHAQNTTTRNRSASYEDPPDDGESASVSSTLSHRRRHRSSRSRRKSRRRRRRSLSTAGTDSHSTVSSSSRSSHRRGHGKKSHRESKKKNSRDSSGGGAMSHVTDMKQDANPDLSPTATDRDHRVQQHSKEESSRGESKRKKSSRRHRRHRSRSDTSSQK